MALSCKLPQNESSIKRDAYLTHTSMENQNIILQGRLVGILTFRPVARPMPGHFLVY